MVVSAAAERPVTRVAKRPGRLARPARSIIGWILALLVIAAFAAAYAYCRIHEGEWTAGTILALMSVPYVSVAHAIGFPDLRLLRVPAPSRRHQPTTSLPAREARGRHR